MTESTSRWERRKLAKTTFALAIVLSFLVGLVLTLFDRHLTADASLSAIGLNLMASVVFAVIFSWLSGNIQERILLANLRDEYRAATGRQENATARLTEKIDALVGELVGRLAGYDRLYMPDAIYDATGEPDSEFNRDISASLRSTSNYSFRGTSAKFVPLRLKTIEPRSLRSVEIITLDPQADNVLRTRALERVRQRQTDNMPTKPVNDLIADIRQEILMSVVALFDQRNMCGINIAFSREPSTTRLEVFDDAVYLSWYQGPKSAKLPFPETFRFPHGSFLYEVYAQEVRRRHEIAEHTLTFRRNTTEAELLTSLERLTGTSIGLDDLTTWRTKYAAFVRSVEGSIGNA